MISETKLDASFPNAQFHVEGYKLYRKDRDSNGGGVIIYIRSDLTSRQRTDLETDQIECISVEILVGNTKWLVMGMYKPPSMKPDTFSTDLQKYLDKVHISIENFILLGDLNYDLSDPTKGKTLRDMFDIFNLQNLIKKPTCFMKDSKPSLVDVILTNKPKLFMISDQCGTGLSDWHNMVYISF